MKYVTPSEQLANAREVHPSQRQHFVRPVNSPLYVVTAVSNPNRYYSRYRLYQAFEKMCEDAGAILYTVELALRDRHFEVTDYNNPRHIQLRSPSQLWHKENLLNIGISRLPEDWEYVAWLDADITFSRPDWAVEAVHMLQHYRVIQMFSHAMDLGPDFQSLPESMACSFMKSWVEGGELPYKRNNSGTYPYPHKGAWAQWHSGYAWAARRSALSDLGGLGDVAVLGSGDHHMAGALIGVVESTIDQRMTASYKKYWSLWQERALRSVKKNVGFMSGLILHNWHGSKKLRRYRDRWRILVENGFDPDLDLKRDVQGLLQLTDRSYRLRDQIMRYFAERNEDSIEIT